MSDQHREISLSIGTMLIVGVLGGICLQIVTQLDRIADTADARMCLQAIETGIDPITLPEPCKGLRRESGGEST